MSPAAPTSMAANARVRLDPQGLAESFRRRAARGPDRPALSFEGRTWTYGDTQTRVEQLSAVLANGGIKAGDRVAYLGFNHPEEMALLFATARLGAIFVPLNFRLSSRELAQIIADAGVHTLIVDAHHPALIDAVRGDLPCQRYLSMAPAAGWDSLTEAMSAPLAIPPPVNGAPDDVVTLIYTSGTTGRPKGVMLSNRNFWANNLSWLLTSDYTSHDITLNVAPLFHVGGLCVVSLPTLLVGGHLILSANFDPAQFMRDLIAYRVTVTFMVPAMMIFISQHPDFDNADLRSLRLIVAGGAPVPEPLLRQYAGRDIPVSQCYGMTEATSGVAFLETDRAIAKLGSCGRAGMLNEVRLLDFSGQVVTVPGERGEICMRGDNVTPGYWNLPEVTAQCFDVEGWFRSGDVGYFDEEGFYFICDRVKDMIISGGENIYPAEVESVIYEHPAVAEAAVIGAADERWGERVLALVVLKPGHTLDLDSLQAFAAGKLARYKMPRELKVIPTMPRNPNGKVIKLELRQQYGQPARTENA
jgi:fatty-acyl-CoA synthase